MCSKDNKGFSREEISKETDKQGRNLFKKGKGLEEQARILVLKQSFRIKKDTNTFYTEKK